MLNTFSITTLKTYTEKFNWQRWNTVEGFQRLFVSTCWYGERSFQSAPRTTWISKAFQSTPPSCPDSIHSADYSGRAPDCTVSYKKKQIYWFPFQEDQTHISSAQNDQTHISSAQQDQRYAFSFRIPDMYFTCLSDVKCRYVCIFNLFSWRIYLTAKFGPPYVVMKLAEQVGPC